MLLCPVSFQRCIPDGNTKTTSRCSPHDVLVAVSVVSSRNREHPINIVRVVDLPLARRQRSYDKESRQAAGTNSPFALSVCVRPVHGVIETDDVVEFIEVNRVFGVEKFVVYHHSSADSKMLDCLRNYERIGLVQLVPWNLPKYMDERVPALGQEMHMTECSHRLMYRTEFLAIVDFDEFIVPMQADDWTSMLRQIDADSGLDPDEIASYCFRNQFVASYLHTPDSLKVIKKTFHAALGVTKENRYRTLIDFAGEDKPKPCGDRSKVIVRPERVLAWHVHYVPQHQVVPPAKVNVCVNTSYGVLQHYRRNKLFGEEKSTECIRMWHFMPGIVNNLKHGMKVCPT